MICNNDGDPQPSAVAFDNTYRRLLVGYSRGACRCFNYSNGSVIHELASDATAEIRVVSCTPDNMREQFLIASGWNCVTWVWPGKSSQRHVAVLFKLTPYGNVDAALEFWNDVL